MSNEHLAAEAVASRVLELAAGLAERGRTVSVASTMRELGLDDLDAIELVMAVEDGFEVDIDVSEYEDAPEKFLAMPLQVLIDMALKAVGQSPAAALRSARISHKELEKVVGHRVHLGKGSLVVEQPVTEQAPKLTPADIEAVIVGEHYFTADQGIAGALAMNQGRSRFFAPSSGGMERVTYCVLELRNGAKVTGVNHGPVSAANFDAAKGREYARENAIEKVWELEGYALRERLMAWPVTPILSEEKRRELMETLKSRKPYDLVLGGQVSAGGPVPDCDRDALAKEMADRFLGWKLPQNFAPDGGVSFVPPFHWPTGTNLLHAGQALDMFRYCLGLDAAEDVQP